MVLTRSQSAELQKRQQQQQKHQDVLSVLEQAVEMSVPDPCVLQVTICGENMLHWSVMMVFIQIPSLGSTQNFGIDNHIDGRQRKKL